IKIVQAKHEADEAAAVATQQKNTATEALASVMQELGRQELFAGRPARAAVYLSEAQTRGHASDVGLRSLLADAMRSIDAKLVFGSDKISLPAVALSPDGTRIVTADDDTAKVWDAATGKLVATLNGKRLRIVSTSFSPDGSRIVTASDDHKARLWDARTGELLA